MSADVTDERLHELVRRDAILRFVEQTLDENNIPSLDAQGFKLNANGRLVDYVFDEKAGVERIAKALWERTHSRPWHEPGVDQSQRAGFRNQARVAYRAARA